MSEQTENKISNDQYGFLEAFEDFTSAYFNLQPENNKLGLFGYINAVISHVGKVGMFHRNRLYNEFCLNTASLPSTIYGTATDEDVEITNATPSKATVVIDILSTDVRNAIKASNKGYIKLDRETFVVKMDDSEFRLPYSVIIRQKENSLSAFYQAVTFIDGESKNIKAENNLLNSFKDYKTNIYVPIKEYVDPETGIQHTNLRVDIFQYKIQNKEETFYEATYTNSAMFQVDYEDQLAEFSVFYKDNVNFPDYIALEKHQNADLVVSSNPFCIYKYIDDDTFQIYFNSSSSVFRPINGSNVLIKTLTTSGSAGNFVFSGTVTAEDTASANPLPFEMNAWVYTQPSGGKDRPTLLEIKRKIFNSRQKVEHKSSADDLNLYFSDISTNLFNDGSKAKFVKTRDDILKREFSGYIMITDEKQRPYPTNTIDSIVLNSQSRKIKPSMPIIYDSANEAYLIIDDSIPVQNIKEYMFDSSKFIYFCPFSVYVDLSNGIPTLHYYDENVNETYPLFYKQVSTESTETPLINYFSCYRNPSVGDAIQMKLPVVLNGSKSYAFVLFIKNADGYVAIPLINNYDGDEEYCTAEFNVGEINTAKNVITCKPTDEFPVYDKNWDKAEEFEIKPESEFFIVTMEAIDEELGLNDNKKNQEYKEFFGNFDTDETGLEKFRVKAISASPEKFKAYESLNDVITSPFDDTAEGNIRIYDLPVAGGLIIFSDEYYNYFISQLRKYINEMKDTVRYLTNNTSLSTKFFNTYGKCEQWKFVLYDSENGENSIVSANRTNLSFRIEIEREAGKDPVIDDQIKEIVKQFVIDLNEQIESAIAIQNRVSLTNLTTKIEEAIPSISSCNIVAVNEIPNVRFIKRDESYDEEEEMLGVTPDYLSLDIKRIPSDMMNVDETNITINYIS